MSKIRKLAGETVLYGLGTILPRTLNFFLVILHTRVFLQETYGIYISLYAWAGVLNVVYLFGMETAYFRFATKEGADEKRVFRVTQTFVLGLSFLLSLSIFLFAPALADYFQVGNHASIITWMAVLLFVDASVAIPFARLRLQKKAVQFAIAKLVNVAIQIGLNLYFLLVIYEPSMGVGYIVLANLFANLFYVLFFINTFISWRPLVDRVLFSSMFRYAYPVMLTGLAFMTTEMFSRLTLGWWLPENFYPGKDANYALGVFGACFRLSVIMNLTVQAFRFAAEPFFFSNATDKDSSILFARVNHYFGILCSFILLAVMVNIDLLKFILDPSYWEGLGVVPILLAAYMFLGMYYNFSVWFKLTDKTHFGTFITIGGAVITILFNYLLIPYFGYVGSSWATLLCYFFMAVICYGFGQKYFPIPYKLTEAFVYLIFALLLIQVSIFVQFSNQALATAFHLFLMVVFAAVVYWREIVYRRTAGGQ